jgi:hypothetical protein
MVGSSLRALPRHFAKLLIVLLCFLANLYAFDLNAHAFIIFSEEHSGKC